MCIIIHRVDGTSKVPDSVLEYNRRANPDGFGIAWRVNDRTIKWIKYGPNDYESFLKRLKEIDATDAEYVAHYRKATHGPKCADLSHPYSYVDENNETVLVFHNGIFSITTQPNESDTQVFVNTVLANLPPRWWENHAIRFLIEEYGDWSKLLIFTPTETVRLNESSWYQKDDGKIWYSAAPWGYSTNVTSKGVVSDDYEDALIPYRSSNSNNSSKVIVHSSFGTRSKDGSGFWHGAHFIVPDNLPRDADELEEWWSGTGVCDDCGVSGEIYLMDGDAYMNFEHVDQWSTYRSTDKYIEKRGNPRNHNKELVKVN